MKKTTYKKMMKQYYQKKHAEKVLGIIFNGTMHNIGNMTKWIDKFREDKRKGKFR